MGVVNLTPDSFSDGGACSTPQLATRHAERMLREGADILDLGAESTRPGAAEVMAQDEWARLAPVLAEAVRWGVPVSVDSQKPEVMQRALEAGADILNDVQGFCALDAQRVLAGHATAGACVMHMRGTPQTMQQLTQYDDVVEEVKTVLGERVNVLEGQGIARHRLVLDPGFGFAKSPMQNVALARHLPVLAELGLPVLVGWSRKSTVGWLTGRAVSDRLAGSLAAALAAVQAGAKILRVHDVQATKDALQVWAAMAPQDPRTP
ncbi:dihydropteroate synthase [Inhella gelatinilytica]|nr:dihydropteroate synthase [Inhella gelatinilytica]